jgi:hypothetical protein
MASWGMSAKCVMPKVRIFESGQIELGGCRPEEAEQGIGVGGGGRLVLLQFVSW